MCSFSFFNFLSVYIYNTLHWRACILDERFQSRQKSVIKTKNLLQSENSMRQKGRQEPGWLLYRIVVWISLSNSWGFGSYDDQHCFNGNHSYGYFTLEVTLECLVFYSCKMYYPLQIVFSLKYTILSQGIFIFCLF